MTRSWRGPGVGGEGRVLSWRLEARVSNVFVDGEGRKGAREAYG